MSQTTNAQPNMTILQRPDSTICIKEGLGGAETDTVDESVWEMDFDDQFKIAN